MIVIFHASCADGFCAAWLLHRAYPDATFVAANYGEPPPDVVGQHVIMADFSYKRPVMEKLIADAASVTVLDHHKTAQTELAGLEKQATIIFDMERSGGQITADYLYNLKLIDVYLAQSWLVHYTGDRDLWKWQMPHSKAINSALALHPFEYDVWDHLHKMMPFELVEKGTAILGYQAQLVDSAVKKATMWEILGHQVPVTNTTVLQSEIGERLSLNHPFSATFFIREDGAKVWSLRSRPPHGIDVSDIARQLGGGGHPAAAGFTQAPGAFFEKRIAIYKPDDGREKNMIVTSEGLITHSHSNVVVKSEDE